MNKKLRWVCRSCKNYAKKKSKICHGKECAHRLEIILNVEIPMHSFDRIDYRGRILFPLFEVSSNPSISLNDLRQRRFDLIERNFKI